MGSDMDGGQPQSSLDSRSSFRTYWLMNYCVRMGFDFNTAKSVSFGFDWGVALI